MSGAVDRRRALRRSFFNQFAIGPVFTARGLKPKPTRDILDFSGRAFNLDKPAGIGNVIEAYRATVEPVFLADFGIGFFDAEAGQFEDALGGLVVDRGLDLEPGFLAAVEPGTFEREHGDVSAMPAEAQFSSLAVEPTVEVKELVSFKTTGVSLCTQREQAGAYGFDAGNTVFLLAFNTGVRNVPLELARQIFLKFSRRHTTIPR